MAKAPLTAEERALPYAKYYDRPLAPIPQEKWNIWRGPAADPALALPVEERNRFLDAEPLPLESGFCVAPGGTGFVANDYFIPGASPEMLDWWFGWHSVGPDLRYKLWDPEDHFYARAQDPDYVLDPGVPNREKTWGVTHHILEDIGFGPEELFLHFKCPGDLGYDMKKLGTPGCAGMVCAVGVGNTPAVMTHKWMEEPGGVRFKSRFWMGYGMDETGNIVKLVPDGKAVPEAAPRALYGHCIKEYANLAAILPDIYAEEKNHFYSQRT